MNEMEVDPMAMQQVYASIISRNLGASRSRRKILPKKAEFTFRRLHQMLVCENNPPPVLDNVNAHLVAQGWADYAPVKVHLSPALLAVGSTSVEAGAADAAEEEIPRLATPETSAPEPMATGSSDPKKVRPTAAVVTSEVFADANGWLKQGDFRGTHWAKVLGLATKEPAPPLSAEEAGSRSKAALAQAAQVQGEAAQAAQAAQAGQIKNAWGGWQPYLTSPDGSHGVRQPDGSVMLFGSPEHLNLIHCLESGGVMPPPSSHNPLLVPANGVAGGRAANPLGESAPNAGGARSASAAPVGGGGRETGGQDQGGEAQVSQQQPRYQYWETKPQYYQYWETGKWDAKVQRMRNQQLKNQKVSPPPAQQARQQADGTTAATEDLAQQPTAESAEEENIFVNQQQLQLLPYCHQQDLHLPRQGLSTLRGEAPPEVEVLPSAGGVFSPPTTSSASDRRLKQQNLQNEVRARHDLLDPRYFKTRPCKFYEVGICAKGGKCEFAHGNEELQAEPDYYKTKICKAWRSGEGCPLGEKVCPYAHGAAELRWMQRPRANKGKKRSKGTSASASQSLAGEESAGASSSWERRVHSVPENLHEMGNDPSSPSSSVSRRPGIGRLGIDRRASTGNMEDAGLPNSPQLRFRQQRPSFASSVSTLVPPSEYGETVAEGEEESEEDAEMDDIFAQEVARLAYRDLPYKKV